VSPESGLTHLYAPGSFTIRVTASYEDGYSSDQVTASVRHLFVTGGIVQPVNMTGSRSSFKIGNTIPMKLRVTECVAAAVGSLVPQVHLAKTDSSAVDVNELVSASAADTGTTMRFTGARTTSTSSTCRRSGVSSTQARTSLPARTTFRYEAAPLVYRAVDNP
jgi:hypothetical protein